MPRAPKPCAKCDTLTHGTYCPACKPTNWHAYPSANTRLVGREAQRQFSRAVLAREPNCRNCGAKATIADHIIRVADGGTNDPRINGQALCAPCHHAKTQAEQRR